MRLQCNRRKRWKWSSQKFPRKSKYNLDMQYGNKTSALKAAELESQLEGIIVQWDMEEKKLFILDYYDMYMPFLDRINASHGVHCYASQTILFLTNEMILRPVAIELSVPSPSKVNLVTSTVFYPSASKKGADWLWQLAKAHVATIDSGYHQLVNHWLRTHATLEPFIVAMHRHLRVESQLQENFYQASCPAAEGLVRGVVSQVVQQNPGLGVGLLRMHFHDCFVLGCDGFVLIDSTLENQAEKDSPINNPSLRGFEVIDSAKAQLEAVCLGVVSCADILAFAARDSVFLLNGPFWNLRSGLRDGTVFNAANVITNLLAPFFNLQQLTSNFAAKGLSQDAMIKLLGAHMIGGAHCTSLSNKL